MRVANHVSQAIVILLEDGHVKLESYFVTAAFLRVELDKQKIPFSYQMLDDWNHIFMLEVV